MTKALAVRVHAYGGPDALVLDEIEIAAPGPGEILIRQAAVGINYLDTYVRRGVFPLPALPGVLGSEAAGTVEAVGPDVDALRPGDRVTYATHPFGAYTTHRVLPATSVLRLPAGLSFDMAAACTLQGLTAHMLVTRVHPLHGGETILVHAAAGGLGSFLCQWARSLGVRVLGTVGSDAKAERVRAFGVEPILRKQEDFVTAVHRLTGGDGIDAVFEGVGGDTLERSLPLLKPFGTAVNLGQVGAPLPAIDVGALGPQRSLRLAVPGVFAHLRTLPDKQAAADETFATILSGAVTPLIGGAWPLEQAAAAHRALEAGDTTGSLILQTGQS